MQKTSRFENIFQNWEDKLFMARLIARLKLKLNPHLKQKDPLPQPYALRAAFKRNDLDAALAVNDMLDKIEKAEFSDMVWLCDMIEHLATYAYALTRWFFISKKVFSVSSDLVDMLMETDFPDFPASDIKFVMESFIIKLDRPLVSATGRKHDFIVVQTDASKSVQVCSFPEGFDRYKPLSPLDREMAKKKASNFDFGIWDKLENRVESGNDELRIFGYTINPGENPYSLYVEEAEEDIRDDVRQLFQLVIGLNLYLQTNRGDDVEDVSTLEDTPSDRGKSLFEGVSLHKLGLSNAFSRSLKTELTDATGKSVRCHWRRGHWRRLSKTDKVVWVRPTLVRRDKAESGEVLQTSEQRVAL